MNQKQFISACLKLFGLYLIFIGVPKLKDGSLEAYCSYRNSKNSPQTEYVSFFNLQDKRFSSIMNEREKEAYLRDSAMHFQYFMNYSRGTSKIIDSIVLILLGLYLCRRGNLILNFVVRKEDIENKIG